MQVQTSGGHSETSLPANGRKRAGLMAVPLVCDSFLRRTGLMLHSTCGFLPDCVVHPSELVGYRVGKEFHLVDMEVELSKPLDHGDKLSIGHE